VAIGTAAKVLILDIWVFELYLLAYDYQALKSRKIEKKKEAYKKQDRYSDIPGVKGSILNFIDEQIERFKFF